MVEMGGYMSVEEYEGREYHDDALALNTGRNCLRYIIRAKRIKRILLPLYLCSAIIDICEEEKVDCEFYHIDREFKPIIPFQVKDDIFLYIVNYFGQLDNEYLKGLALTYPNIIVDQAQAFFQQPVKGIDTIYTCRKFFGVPDGAYLYTDTIMQDDINSDLSVDKWKYIIGRYEKSASYYYSDYLENELLLKEAEIKKMSLMTKNVLKSLNYDKINRQRIDNVKMLDERLGKYNLLKVKVGEYGLYSYPMLIEEGNIVKDILIGEKIYIPTLWSDVLSNPKADNYAKYLTRNLLPLPCDQRYTEKDMEYMIDRVMKILNL